MRRQVTDPHESAIYVAEPLAAKDKRAGRRNAALNKANQDVPARMRFEVKLRGNER